MGKKTDVLFWIDVETTGIEAHKEKLLEVAAIATDTDLNVLDEQGYEAIIKYSPEEVSQMKETTDPYVLNMHTKGGLWDRLPEGKPLTTVEAELLAYLKKVAPEQRQARLAGNSCTLDIMFTREHMPSVAEHLHYRILDVSTLSAIAQWSFGVKTFQKKLEHRAMSDIKESIKEYEYLLKEIARKTVKFSQEEEYSKFPFPL